MASNILKNSSFGAAQPILTDGAHYAELLFVKKDDFKPNFDTTYSRHV